MKKAIMLFVLLLTACGLYAQGTDLDPSFNAIWAFFLPSISVAALTLWTDTFKHVKAGTWEWSVAWRTKLAPFLITHVVAVLIYLVLSYVPWALPFIEAIAETELGAITAGAIVGLASGLVDGFLKKK